MSKYHDRTLELLGKDSSILSIQHAQELIVWAKAHEVVPEGL